MWQKRLKSRWPVVKSRAAMAKWAKAGSSRGKAAKAGGSGGKKAGRRDGRPAADERTKSRKAKRRSEEEDIRKLEERVKAEAPHSGHSSAVGQDATSDTGVAVTTQLFKELPISVHTLKGLTDNQFVKTTEIQRSAIPHALAGRDILGEAIIIVTTTTTNNNNDNNDNNICQ